MEESATEAPSATAAFPAPSLTKASSSSAATTNQPSSSEYVPQFHFSGAKAGMELVDKSKLEKIIAEVSKGNPYYERAAETDQRILERAKVLRKKADDLTAKELSVARIEVSRRTTALERAARNGLHRVVVCVDMDQFFVAVEVRDDPKLKGLPLAVGLNLISTASYEARKYGVRSAMPTFIGKRLCPELVVVPGRYDAYSEASKRAQSVFATYDRNYSMMSLDECFLDLGERMNGLTLETDEGVAKAKELVEMLRKEVQVATGGLTCSAGVASSKMLAKVCSERNKPNGSFVLKADYDILLEFVRALPVRKVPGIGKASELLLLHAFDIKTVNDLFDKRFVLSKCLTPAIVDFYLRVPLCATEVDSNGSANTKVTSFFGFKGDNAQDGQDLDLDKADSLSRHELATEDDGGRKSISIERTFRAIENETDLVEKLKHLSTSLAEEMYEKMMVAHTLTLKLKTDQFAVRTRGESLRRSVGGQEGPSVTARRIVDTLLPILRQEMPIRIRLMGIRASNLERFHLSYDQADHQEEEEEEEEGREDFQHVTKGPINNDDSGGFCTDAANGDGRKRQHMIEDFIRPKAKRTDAAKDCKDCEIILLDQNTEGDANSGLGSPADEQENHGLWMDDGEKEDFLVLREFEKGTEFEQTKGDVDSNLDSMADRGGLRCPVCGESLSKLSLETNDEVNEHIDTCLNVQTVAALMEPCVDAPRGKDKHANAQRQGSTSSAKFTLDRFLAKSSSNPGKPFSDRQG